MGPRHGGVTTEERFYAKVLCDLATGCWLWIGAPLKSGYGSFYDDGRTRRAHIVSYEMHVGPTTGLNVLHTCDVRLCVRPTHLFLGTQAINVRDALDKGRMLIGELNGQHKLTEADILVIRNTYKRGNQPELAATFGVSRSMISRVITRDRWNHV